MRVIAVRPIFSAIALLMIAGCATPPAALLTPVTTPQTGAPLSAAMAYLDQARDLYRRTVTQQLADEANLGDGLIGVFAAVAAMAVGHAHRDAIFGSSLIAGTSYTIGNRRLPRPRVLAYIAGLDALTCARRAVAPFNADVAAIADATSALQIQVDNFEASLGTAQALYAANVGPDPAAAATNVKNLGETIEAAKLAKQASQTSLDGARSFLAASARAATQLVAAVDQIDTAVIKAVAEGTPTLASVPGVISGLAGLVGTFAPGAGFEALIDNRLAAVNGTAKSLVNVGDQIADTNQALMTAAASLRQAQGKLNGLLVGRAAPWSEDAFRDCNVAQVATPLAAAPANLNFLTKVDARRSITLSGGVKPYFVEVDGEGRDGFTVKAPLRFDSRVEVSVNGAKLTTPFTTTLQVVDSSPNPRPLTIPVSVTAAPAAITPASTVAPADAPPTTAAAISAIDQGMAALKNVGAFDLDNGTYQVPSLPIKLSTTNTIEVRVLCPMGTKATRPRILQALLTQAKINTPLATLPWKLTLAAGSTNCPAT